jgi:hypothetical protein
VVVFFGTGLCGFIGGLTVWRRLRSLEPTAPFHAELSNEGWLSVTLGPQLWVTATPVSQIDLLPGWVAFELEPGGARRHVDLALTETQRAALVRRHRLPVMFLLLRVLGVVRLELLVKIFTFVIVMALVVRLLSP